uniref:polynucleotide adenylyltransferase n=1 Tax=Macrostomum lignano TaxID=282301 RepID=A0A1I8G9S5_9PLAT
MSNSQVSERIAASKDDLDCRRFSVLRPDQVQRLSELLRRRVALRGRTTPLMGVGSEGDTSVSGCPVLRMRLRDLLHRLLEQLGRVGVAVPDVRLNGSSASFVIGGQPDQCYNDVDLLFSVDLSAPATLDKIKSAVWDSLRTCLPEGERQLQQVSMDSYIRKLVRVLESDRWSLISLGGCDEDDQFHQADDGREDADCVAMVELKFVDRMRRQFEFTVDSFQIVLESIGEEGVDETKHRRVLAESVSGSFAEAVSHLASREICTRNPEEIRGGGLLKYCRLLAEGYRPAAGIDPASLEKYMCSRFFIDFPDPELQLGKIRAYLAAHFPRRPGRLGSQQTAERRLDYLGTLRSVVQSSTICLMHRERHSILRLITLLAEEVRDSQKAVSLEPFSSGAGGWRAEQIVYGTGHFPWQLMDSIRDQRDRQRREGSGEGRRHRPLFGCIVSTSGGHIAFNCLSSMAIVRHAGVK